MDELKCPSMSAWLLWYQSPSSWFLRDGWEIVKDPDLFPPPPPMPASPQHTAQPWTIKPIQPKLQQRFLILSSLASIDFNRDVIGMYFLIHPQGWITESDDRMAIGHTLHRVDRGGMYWVVQSPMSIPPLGTHLKKLNVSRLQKRWAAFYWVGTILWNYSNRCRQFYGPRNHYLER